MYFLHLIICQNNNNSIVFWNKKKFAHKNLWIEYFHSLRGQRFSSKISRGIARQLLNVNDFLPSRFTWKMALLIFPSLFPSQNYMGLWEMLCDLGCCTTSHLETGNWEAFRPHDIKVVGEAEMKCLDIIWVFSGAPPTGNHIGR